MCRPSALPFFERVLENFELSQKTWHGDSYAFVRTWEQMDKPDIGFHEFLGLTVELRDYRQYAGKKSKFSQQYKAEQKLKLVTN